jgi:glycosyltransferase involved in cell wall biosynthesis
VFVHSSDELYGADRVVLDIHAALPEEWRARAEFWLPTDIAHGTAPLCVELEQRGALVRHLDLPVLRRSYLRPGGLIALGIRLLRFAATLRRRRPALLYCTTSALFLTAPLARVVGVKRRVGHVQELWSSLEARVLGPFARSLDELVVISEPVKGSLPRYLRGRAHVVLNATKEPEVRGSLDAREGPLTFVVASRWNSGKGHRTLLAAWDLVDSPGRLVVLGGPPPVGERVDVPGLVRALRFPASVEVVGEVADAASWIDRADVVLVPSDKLEGLGLVAVEAFAHGRPVVASAGGGLGEVVTHGSDGWLFPAGDVTALATLLGGLSREEVARAGSRARTTYEERFTPGRFEAEWRRALVGPDLAPDPPAAV